MTPLTVEKPRDPRVTARIMAAVRGKNTEPEWLLRRALFGHGLRFRVHVKALPGCPDIVFSCARVVVFVDGDFWHGGGWRERGFESMEAQFAAHARPEFWITKIRANVERDQQVNKMLAKLGWHVLRLWESEVRSSPAKCITRVVEAISGKRRRA